MRKAFKRKVWSAYRFLYRVWMPDKEPNPKISLCKMSWSLLGLGLAGFGASLVVLFLALVVYVPALAGTTALAAGGWFLGFSPTNPKKWLDHNLLEGTKDDLWKYLPPSEKSLQRKHYKMDKSIAPWEVVLFPIPLTAWAFRKEAIRDPVLYTVGAPFLILWGITRCILWPATKFLGRGAFKGARRASRCPFPLDFSDVAKLPDTEKNPEQLPPASSESVSPEN